MLLNAKNAQGEVLFSAEGENEAFLVIQREYQEGDAIEIIAEPGDHLFVQMDAAMQEGEVYLPQGRMLWPIPFGDQRNGYSPTAFMGGLHLVTARKMTASEIASVRNIALNPADLRGETDFFPHATANVETRGEAQFFCRNVIDGMRVSFKHGPWPFDSWGIGAREDAWCQLDFGRPVVTDRMLLTLRADFPHDAYWVRGHVVLSDGAEIEFPLEKRGDRQEILLGGMHTITWARLERLIKSDDPSAFPSLTQWEVIGRDEL